MTARLYPVNVEYITDPSMGWESLSLRAVMVTSLFEYDGANAYLSDLLPAHLVGSSEVLENPTLSGSLVAGGAPFAWTPFIDAREVTGVVLYADFDDPAYSPLLAFYPSDQLIGVPLVPSGLAYFLYPSADLGGFFQLFDEEITGALATVTMASGFALAEIGGGLTAAFPDLLLGATLDVRDKACMPADVEDECCSPVIRSSLCE